MKDSAAVRQQIRMLAAQLDNAIGMLEQLDAMVGGSAPTGADDDDHDAEPAVFGA